MDIQQWQSLQIGKEVDTGTGMTRKAGMWAGVLMMA